MSHLRIVNGHLARTVNSPYHLALGCSEDGPTPCSIRDNNGIPEVSFDGVEWIPLSTTYTVSATFDDTCGGGDIYSGQATLTWTGAIWNGPFLFEDRPTMSSNIRLGFTDNCCYWQLVVALHGRVFKTSGISPAGSYIPHPCGHNSDIDGNCNVTAVSAPFLDGIEDASVS